MIIFNQSFLCRIFVLPYSCFSRNNYQISALMWYTNYMSNMNNLFTTKYILNHQNHKNTNNNSSSNSTQAVLLNIYIYIYYL
eukprot:gene8336-5843_t